MNLSNKARLAIEEMIYDGLFLPGAALDERALAERLGMSRTPIREAIRQLEAQGLVRVLPRAGVVVTKLTIRELLSLFELLAELEASCARLAARRIDNVGKAQLVDASKRCEQAAENEDFMAYENANLEFHQILYKACNNKYLVEQIMAIRKRTGVFRRNLFEKTSRLRVSAADHRNITEAILAGHDAAAEDATRSHIVIGGQGFAEFVSTVPDSLVAL